MKNIYTYQNSFVRQTNQNNCGIACICMILRFAGQTENSRELEQKMDHYVADSSLLDLKNIIAEYNRKARCVQIDIDTLRNLKSPVILYTLGMNGRNHFLTLFEIRNSSDGNLYIIGDPGQAIRVMAEVDFLKIWPSRTGLFIEDLQMANAGNIFQSWRKAFDWQLIPKPLFYCVPIVHLLVLVFTIGLSALLQSLLTSGVKTTDHLVMVLAIMLLMILIYCKGLLNYVRQLLLVSINKIINTHLTLQLAHKMLTPDKPKQEPEFVMKKNFVDITKFQLSIHGLIAVILSDGLILLVFFGGLMYLDPYAEFVTIFYSVLLVTSGIREAANKLLYRMYLNGLHQASEDMLIHQSSMGNNPDNYSRFQAYNSFYMQYIRQGADHAAKLSKKTFRNELAGGLHLIAILTLELLEMDRSISEIAAITVICYLTSIFLQRINEAMPMICEGLLSAGSLIY